MQIEPYRRVPVVVATPHTLAPMVGALAVGAAAIGALAAGAIILDRARRREKSPAAPVETRDKLSPAVYAQGIRHLRVVMIEEEITLTSEK